MYEVYINDVKIDSCYEEGFQIESILGQTIDTATVKIHDENNTISIAPMSDIYILDNNNNKIFSGLVTIINIETDGTHKEITLNCQDYTFLLFTSYVYKNYNTNFTLTIDGVTYTGDKARIIDCFVNTNYGTLANNPEIDAITYVDPDNESPLRSSMSAESYNTITLADFMNTMCGYTGWTYYVDYDKKLHYYKKSYDVAPVSLSDTPNNVTSFGYRSIKLKEDGTSIRNQFMLYGTNLKASTQVLDIYSVANQQKYMLDATVAGQNVIMLAPAGYETVQVYIGDSPTSLSVGTYSESSDNNEYDVYISPVQQFLWFPSTSSYLPTTSNVRIRIMYTFAYKYGQYDEDTFSIYQYQRPFMKLLSASDANSVIAINQKMTTYKEQFAYDLRTITLKLDNIDLGNNELKTGQWINIKNNLLGINNSYLIYRISTRILGGSIAEYELELRNWYTES